MKFSYLRGGRSPFGRLASSIDQLHSLIRGGLAKRPEMGGRRTYGGMPTEMARIHTQHSDPYFAIPDDHYQTAQQVDHQDYYPPVGYAPPRREESFSPPQQAKRIENTSPMLPDSELMEINAAIDSISGEFMSPLDPVQADLMEVSESTRQCEPQTSHDGPLYAEAEWGGAVDPSGSRPSPALEDIVAQEFIGPGMPQTMPEPRPDDMAMRGLEQPFQM